jgi:hypothetical protein
MLIYLLFLDIFGEFAPIQINKTEYNQKSFSLFLVQIVMNLVAPKAAAKHELLFNK